MREAADRAAAVHTEAAETFRKKKNGLPKEFVPKEYAVEGNSRAA